MSSVLHLCRLYYPLSLLYIKFVIQRGDARIIGFLLSSQIKEYKKDKEGSRNSG